MKAIERYQRMHALLRTCTQSVADDTRLICVIPCMYEPDVPVMVRQLLHALPTSAEIIVVINHPAGSGKNICEQNRSSAEALQALAPQVLVMQAFNLPAKQAGVGMARKLGMDEAMLRLAAADHPDGLIASLDADCQVDQDYGHALLQYADAHPQQHAMLCAFEHPLDTATSAQQRQAIVDYEMFLRTIALGWRLAGLPYAFTAIGSCMVVRANAYARHSGMNRRQAGEDFYFMHKLAREQAVVTLKQVCVRPSARISTRTPFGTGQAIRAWCAGERQHRYMADVEVFLHLQQMVQRLPDLFDDSIDHWLQSLATPLADFLRQQGVIKAVQGMQQNARQADSLVRHFFTWFDGLKAWRYVHLMREHSPQPLAQVAWQCLQLTEGASMDDTALLHPETLLQKLRRM